MHEYDHWNHGGVKGGLHGPHISFDISLIYDITMIHKLKLKIYIWWFFKESTVAMMHMHII